METDPARDFVYLACDLTRIHISSFVTMATQIKLMALVLLALALMTEGRFFFNGFNGYLPPLLIEEQPFAVDPTFSAVPLVLMPQERLTVVPVSDVQISGFSLTQPFVTLQAPNEPEAMPAVQVALPHPLWVAEPEVTIGFPSSFTVVHDGVCMPIPVGAVVAPVPSGTYISPAHPIPITVVYAIPTAPLPPQYPVPYPTRRPNVTEKVPQIVTFPTRPTKPQLVTILDFPSTVQTPPVLVYQPPTGLDDELENRNPPQGVVPAGIVQSAAPTPNLSVFINSKESTVLQELRDQAANRFKALRT